MRFHRYTEPEHLSPFPHVVLDTSHFGVAEVDINPAWDQLRHQAVHLHVSDNRGQGRDSHAPLGHGILPLGSFLHTVGADETTETSITLELDCRRYLDDRAALVGYLRQELQKCRALLDGEPGRGGPRTARPRRGGPRAATRTTPTSRRSGADGRRQRDGRAA